jgi:hypothetical protein
VNAAAILFDRNRPAYSRLRRAEPEREQKRRVTVEWWGDTTTEQPALSIGPSWRAAVGSPPS